MTLIRAVECDANWNEDEVPVKTDIPAAPQAEIQGRAAGLYGTATPCLWDWHLCDKLPRSQAATNAAWSRTVFPYALSSRFLITPNQDI